MRLPVFYSLPLNDSCRVPNSDTVETTTEAKTGVEIEDGSDGQDAKPDSEATATAEDGKDEKVDEV